MENKNFHVNVIAWRLEFSWPDIKCKTADPMKSDILLNCALYINCWRNESILNHLLSSVSRLFLICAFNGRCFLIYSMYLIFFFFHSCLLFTIISSFFFFFRYCQGKACSWNDKFPVEKLLILSLFLIELFFLDKHKEPSTYVTVWRFFHSSFFV